MHKGKYQFTFLSQIKGLHLPYPFVTFHDQVASSSKTFIEQDVDVLFLFGSDLSTSMSIPPSSVYDTPIETLFHLTFFNVFPLNLCKLGYITGEINSCAPVLGVKNGVA